MNELTNKDHLMAIGEKAMAPHSSTLAWRIPGKEEPGGLYLVSERAKNF